MQTCCGFLITAQCLGDRLRVENGNRRTTMGTCVFRADVDGRAASRATNCANAGGDGLNLRRCQLADKSFLDHELAEECEAPVTGRAAVITETSAARHVATGLQPIIAARAAQRRREWLPNVIAMGVNVLEQCNDAPRHKLFAFEGVEPDALAWMAKIERQGAATLAL